jgi:hypothetical protein
MEMLILILNHLNWKQITKTEYSKDEKNEYDFEILELEKV